MTISPDPSPTSWLWERLLDGNVSFLPGRIGLAPMAGYTDHPFRKLCREFGARFAFTEMISAKSVILGVEANKFYFPKAEETAYVGVQLFGSDPYELAEAAKLVEHLGLWVDLNAGCPVSKVVKRGAGSALLRDLNNFRTVVRALRGAVKRLSVKTRLGWDRDEFERIYNILAEEGVDIIFVHGRTAKQMYSGRARWDIYNPGQVPLFLSGDLFSPEDVARAIEISGASGVIVARGAIGNPWIFSGRSPSHAERLETMLRHLHYLDEEYGDHGAVNFRKFVAGYTAGLPNARELRRRVMEVRTIKLLKEILISYFREIAHDRSGLEVRADADLPG